VQAAFLTAKENRELQQALKLQYARLDYVCFVNELLFSVNNSNSSVAITMCDDLLFVLNKILLDNIFRYVVAKNTHGFMFLLAHGTFGKDIYINPFYVAQVLESTGVYISDEDKTEIENKIIQKLQLYIDDMYSTNTDSLNVPLLGMFEVMFNNLQHINIGYYKFELMNYVQPILLYTERHQYENYLYS
jgi:hypothetical protein